MRVPFRKRICRAELAEHGVVVADGGMGTRLYEKGIFINRCFDELVLSQPALILEVHQEYVDAGAELIETNTFGANRYRLSYHGLEHQQEKINQRAVELAREAAGEDRYVAGAIGPVQRGYRTIEGLTRDSLAGIFREQAEYLVRAGVDLLIIETSAALSEVIIATQAIRDVTDLPIIAQTTFNDNGYTPAGDRPEQVVRALSRLSPDIIGTNCSSGPKAMLDILKRMAACSDLPLSAMPNAGMPQLHEGRYLYLTSPEYFAEYGRRFRELGAVVIGGCCGTRPEHIHELVRFLPKHRETSVIKRTPICFEDRPKSPIEVTTPIAERSEFAHRLHETDSFLFSVEVTPPRGVDIDRVLSGVRSLQAAGIHAVNIPDGPRASARISPLALAVRIEQELGMETILHYCCRDRNLLGMQADLMGAHVLGLRNLLLITGDPPKLGDYPDATAVFDIDSIGLVNMVRNLNQGMDLAGTPLQSSTSFHIGVGVNPSALDLETEVARFFRKRDMGAEFILTQPIFEVALLERFLAKAEPLEVPVMAGILPLASYKNAEFLHNEVPGMRIPESIRLRMKEASENRTARQQGIQIAVEMLQAIRQLPGIRGVYFMPPFGRYDTILKLVEMA